jgi:hypothetical protein
VEIPTRDSYSVEFVLRLMLRYARAETRAREVLDAVRENVLAGQTLEAAAEEKGLLVRELKGISEESVARPPIEPPEGGELTAEQKAENLLRGYRRHLLAELFPRSRQAPGGIRRTEPGRFMKDLISDRETDAAYLVYVDSMEAPESEEMPDLAAGRVANEMTRLELIPGLRRYFSFEEVKERYRVEFPRANGRQ